MRLGARLGILVALLVVTGAALVAGLAVGRKDAQQQSGPSAGTAFRPATTDEQIAELQARATKSPTNAQVHTSLGFAYLQKVRESGDPSFYPRAEGVLKTALELDPTGADTLIGLGSLALARHEFEQGLTYGLQAKDLNPYKAAAYSVIGDAQIELGRYDDARATVQAMVNLRPDLTSYARVSYVRELNGDLPGAIEAMRQAVTAGSPGTESLAWTRVQLGHLYFNTGDLAAAQKEYERTLFEYPDYLHARAGLARVMAARTDYGGAIGIYQEIARTMPLPEYVIALADVQRAAGNTEDAARTEQLVEAMDQLYRANGVRTDVEMALFRADRGLSSADTVEAARQALTIRPGIHAADALAWALYQAGRSEEAQATSDQALRLGTRDSLIHFHAGMIAARLGQTDRARTELSAALTLNPHFSVRWAEEAREMLKKLGAVT